MQVEVKCDKLIPCVCGGKPDHFWIGYGRMPYYGFCPKCGKGTERYIEVGGPKENFITCWNAIAPLWHNQIIEALENIKKEDWLKRIQALRKVPKCI